VAEHGYSLELGVGYSGRNSRSNQSLRAGAPVGICIAGLLIVSQ